MATYKFGRVYQMAIQGVTAKHMAALPLTLKFMVNRTLYSGSNEGNFTLFGLGQSARNDIYVDCFLNPLKYEVTLSAGYKSIGPQLSQIFTGNIVVAYTERQGPEQVTHIHALDGGFGAATGVIPSNLVIKKGTTFEQGIQQIFTAGFPAASVRPGKVLVTSAPRPAFGADYSPKGNTMQVLDSLKPPGGKVFIDKGVINMLGPDDTLPATGNQLLVTPDTGLLNTPRRYGTMVQATMILEPTANIGDLVQLQSTLNPNVDGPYQVIGVRHEGTISAVESGDATTTLSLAEAF
jgi:hypothetical protein